LNFSAEAEKMVDVCPRHSGIEAELHKICALLDERQIQADLRFQFISESINLAKGDMERRLEEMNRMRHQLTEQAGTFATRGELKTEAEKLDLKLAPLLRYGAIQEGSTRWTDYLIMAIISTVIVAVSRLLG